MSSLKASIEERLASEPAGLACVSIGSPTPCVVLSLWKGEHWVLPWAYLISVRFTLTEESAQLVFTFTSHAVTAEGHNLLQLLEPVASFRLGLLRELPVRYRAQLPADASFITHMEVHPIESAPGFQ